MLNVEAEVEMEYKALISKSKFMELEKYLSTIAKSNGTYQQINYYFDSPNMLLKGKKVTLRLRDKQGTWELTVKVPKKTKFERCTVKDEFNFPITNEEAMVYIQQGIFANDVYLKELFESLKINVNTQFNCLGSLKTMRTEFLFYTDVIALDYNQYNSIEDYEIEWETSNHSFVKQQFIQLGLFDLPSKGKRSRFLKTVKKLLKIA